MQVLSTAICHQSIRTAGLSQIKVHLVQVQPSSLGSRGVRDSVGHAWEEPSPVACRVDLVLLTQAQQCVERPLASREAGVLPLAIVGDEPRPTGIFYFLTHFIHAFIYINGGKQHLWWSGTDWRKGYTLKEIGQKIGVGFISQLEAQVSVL